MRVSGGEAAPERPRGEAEHGEQRPQHRRHVHDLPARAQAAATAAPTTAGVVANGAAGIPSVNRPRTKPGRSSTTRAPLPCKASTRPDPRASRPALLAP
jgi:hypothetical protein